MTISRKIAQNIVDEAHGAIHRDINFMDTGGTIIASSDPARVGQFHSGAMKVLASGLPRLVITEENAREGVRPGINIPVLLDDEPVGVIGITGDPALVSDYGEIIRRMTEIMLLAARDQQQGILLDQARDLYLENWLFQEQADWNEFSNRGRLLNIDIHIPYLLVLLTAAPLSEDGAELGEMQSGRILQFIRQRIAPSKGEVCTLLRNQVLLLLNTKTRGRDCRSFVEQLMDTIQATFSVRVWCGGSESDGAPQSIQSCYREAQIASSVASHHPQFLMYVDASLDLIAESIPAPILQNLQQIVFNRCTAQEKEEYTALIRLYFVCDGSLGRCAQELYVHRNTVQYRIDQLEQKTGFRLRVPHDAALLYLSAYPQNRNEF